MVLYDLADEDRKYEPNFYWCRNQGSVNRAKHRTYIQQQADKKLPMAVEITRRLIARKLCDV